MPDSENIFGGEIDRAELTGKEKSEKKEMVPMDPLSVQVPEAGGKTIGEVLKETVALKSRLEQKEQEEDARVAEEQARLNPRTRFQQLDDEIWQKPVATVQEVARTEMIPVAKQLLKNQAEANLNAVENNFRASDPDLTEDVKKEFKEMLHKARNFPGATEDQINFVLADSARLKASLDEAEKSVKAKKYEEARQRALSGEEETASFSPHTAGPSVRSPAEITSSSRKVALDEKQKSVARLMKISEDDYRDWMDDKVPLGLYNSLTYEQIMAHGKKLKEQKKGVR